MQEGVAYHPEVMSFNANTVTGTQESQIGPILRMGEIPYTLSAM